MKIIGNDFSGTIKDYIEYKNNIFYSAKQIIKNHGNGYAMYIAFYNQIPKTKKYDITKNKISVFGLDNETSEDIRNNIQKIIPKQYKDLFTVKTNKSKGSISIKCDPNITEEVLENLIEKSDNSMKKINAKADEKINKKNDKRESSVSKKINTITSVAAFAILVLFIALTASSIISTIVFFSLLSASIVIGGGLFIKSNIKNTFFKNKSEKEKDMIKIKTINVNIQNLMEAREEIEQKIKEDNSKKSTKKINKIQQDSPENQFITTQNKKEIIKNEAINQKKDIEIQKSKKSLSKKNIE